MNREQWYELYQDIRTPAHGENLFPKDERAEIALLIAYEERKAKRKALTALKLTKH